MLAYLHQMVSSRLGFVSVERVCAPASDGKGGNTPKPPVGLYASLSESQKKAVLAYDGPVFGGDPTLPRVKPSRR